MFGGDYPILYWTFIQPGMGSPEFETEAEARSAAPEGALILPVVDVPNDIVEAALAALAEESP